MPHASVRLADGVNNNRTPTLNEFGLSASQLIRYQFDDRGAVLAQKLGGWTKYYSGQMVAVPRALWGWEDTEGNLFLAVGMENRTNSYRSQLATITGGVLTDRTPKQTIDDITAAFSTTAGSSIVTITDATTQNITQFDTVYIPTHVSIGGIVLFGLYACNPDGHSAATTFTIQSVDVLGNALPATATTTTEALANLATVNGSSVVTVTLNNHGYGVGDSFPVLVPTTVGGSLFSGHYPVNSVTSANVFTIIASTVPSATTNGFVNNNFAQYIFSFGRYGGSVPGIAIPAQDWVEDNWGEILIASAVPSPIVLTVNGGSGDGATGTLTFVQDYTIAVNSTIVVAGLTPSGWNGTYVVTAASSGSVSFATVQTTVTGGGTVTVGNASFAPIFYWDAEAGQSIAQVMPHAPPYNDGFFVAMPQRQIIAWGSTFTGISDPLLLRWCDVNNFNAWIALVTNQAGSWRLTSGSRIVGGIQGPQQGLIWTDIDLWSMQYIGFPYVYSFNKIATGCGLIGRKAAASLGGVIYWMGPTQFFTLNSSGVQPLPCPVWDIAFQNIDTNSVNRIRTAVNSQFNEIGWYFPTTSSSGEVVSYVKYNALLGLWDYGTLSRSAWIDQSALGKPIGADPSSLYLYQHETSPDADGAALVNNCQTGYFALEEGQDQIFIDQVWPDAKYGPYGQAQSATINLNIYTANYPSDTPVQYGPFAITSSSGFVSPRLRGRLVALQWGTEDVGSFWRLGLFRFRFQIDGRV